MTSQTTKVRRLKGVVTSNKMQKTIAVRVNRLKKHSKYLKYFKTHTKFLAHDEKNEAKVGDIVIICETRPMSRRKRWTLAEVLVKSKVANTGEE